MLSAQNNHILPVFDAQLYQLLIEGDLFVDEVTWLQEHIKITHKERERFLNNEVENPHFVYRKQNPVPDFADKLLELQNLINVSDAPEVVVDLYRRKLARQMARKQMVAASASQNDEQFFIESCAMYGKPKKKYFAYVAKRLLKLCHDQKNSHPGPARRLRSVVAKINTENVEVDAGILPPIVTKGKLIEGVAEVKKIFADTLERCEITGWGLQVDEEGVRSRFSVNSNKKIIHIPSEEQILARPTPLTDVKVKALAEHEIGVHVRRSHEGAKNRLLLLESGLDGYITGEEGLAAYVQQQIEGANEFYGFDRYLAACLALGMDGVKRDFRSVFSLMTDYYTLRFAQDGLVETEPYRAAWDVCVRIFRGTTGGAVGFIYTKDIVYMEGNIGIWHLLSEKPQIFESLFIGKFNPLLSRHVRTLQTLEILKEW